MYCIITLLVIGRRRRLGRAYHDDARQADFDYIYPASAGRAERGKDVRLHARFDRARPKALGDGSGGCFHGPFEAGGITGGDLGS